jgi:uncharacterized protein (TIGR02246 family)
MPSNARPLLRIVLVVAVAAAGLSLTHTSSSAKDCQVVPDPRAKANELFKAWNDALYNKKPADVAALYADNSVLLATVSNQPRLSRGEKEDYFKHFQEKKPSGQISPYGRKVFYDCDTLIDAGLYTFTYANIKPGDQEQTRARYSFTYRFFENGKWLITSHHSSKMPETELVCRVRVSAPADVAARVCPGACSETTANWSWGEWSGQSWAAGPTAADCGCFRTPKEEGYTGGCSAMPTKPKG